MVHTIYSHFVHTITNMFTPPRKPHLCVPIHPQLVLDTQIVRDLPEAGVGLELLDEVPDLRPFGWVPPE